MELKVLKERVIDAAKNNPSAKPVLKDLFPEAFDNLVTFTRRDGTYHIIIKDRVFDGSDLNPSSIQIRTMGNYSHKGLFLNGSFYWEIVVDNEGYQVLTARRKF